MRDNQTILTITKIVPTPNPGSKPTTTILTFPEAHLAKQHLETFFTAEKTILAEKLNTNTESIFLIPPENTFRQRIITQKSGEQDFDILANHYHVAWLNIDGCSSVTNEEMQSALDGFVNSGRTTTEYAQVAESISLNMHRYCQNELWKFVKEIIKAFALGPHDERNKTAADQALQLQGFIENSNEF